MDLTEQETAKTQSITEHNLQHAMQTFTNLHIWHPLICPFCCRSNLHQLQFHP